MLVCAAIFFVLIFSATPSFALDLNSFRAQHKLPALSYSATLAGAAYEQAHTLARLAPQDDGRVGGRACALNCPIPAPNSAGHCRLAPKRCHRP